MAQTIKLKRSATSGGIPGTSSLSLGELAINTYDGKIFIKKSVGGTESIVEIGGSSTQQTAIWKAYSYTAGSSQTSYSGSDNNSQTLKYTSGYIEVYLNGILLNPATDYTANTGAAVVLTDAPTTGDLVQISTFVKVLGTADTIINTFTGVTNQVAFTLTSDPGTEANTNVFVNAVYQTKDTYSVSGTTLTFGTAPSANDDIEITIGSRNLSVIDVDDFSITGTVTATGGVSTEWNTAYTYSQVGHLPLAGGALTGAVTTNSTFDGVDIATRDAILTSTTTTAGAALPKAGGAMTGAITTNSTFDGVDIAARDTVLTNTAVLANAASPLNSPTFTGVPAAPTAAANTNTTQLATTAYVQAELTSLVGGASTALDTLGEIATSLGNNADLSGALTTSIAGKLPLAGGTMTGPLIMNETTAVQVSKGTTGQRPSGVAGQFRYNTTEDKFEGYGTEWGEIGGGAADLRLNTFTGNGSTVAYTLTTSPLEKNTLAYIDGVYQNKSVYSISGQVLTFTDAPDSGAAIEITAATVAPVQESTDFLINQYTGNGSTVAYTLSEAPTSENQTSVYLSGVYQSKTNYSVSGVTLTFVTAPPNATPIEVMVARTVVYSAGTPDDNTVSTVKIVNGAVTAAKLNADVSTTILNTPAITGALTTNSTIDGVDIATRDAILTSTTTTAGAALPKAGGAMTGAITTNSTFDGVDIAARDAVLTSTTTTAGAALPLAGGTLTGATTFGAEMTINPAANRKISFKDSGNIFRAGIQAVDTGGQMIATSAANDFAIRSQSHILFSSGGNVESMRLSSAGKVLIGDTASHTADLLQIETPASGGGHGIQIRRNDSNTDQGVGRIQFGNNTATDLASISAKTDGATDSGALLFNTSATGGAITERMHLSSTGDLLVGTSTNVNVLTGTPKVQIGSGSGHSSLQFYSGNGNVAGIYFADGTSGAGSVGVDGRYPGYIEYSHSDDTLRIRSGGSGSLYLKSNQDVEVVSGNLVIGTSGKGIDFSATGGPTNGSGTSELLDDYEEGTWTPSFAGGTLAVTTNSEARYVKIGTQVTLFVYIQISNVTDSTTLYIQGVPFTDSGAYSACNIVQCSAQSTGEAIIVRKEINDDKLYFTTALSQASVQQTQVWGHIIFSLTYRTNS